MPLPEGELSFEFTGSLAVERLDGQGRRLPQDLKLVDFVVEERARRLLIEVKDPSDAGAMPERQAEWLRTLSSNTLIHENLTPKARGSYLYLHLMELDDKPMVFVVVLGLERIPFDLALLAPFQDRLRSRLAQETETPWKRSYVSECVVVHLGNWATLFPAYALTRG